MCIVVANQENSKKSIKSDYFGVKPVVLIRFGGSPKIGIFHKFYQYSNKTSTFGTIFFPKIQKILHILQVVHSQSSTFSMANPQKLGIDKYSFNKYHTWYLFENCVWFYVVFWVWKIQILAHTQIFITVVFHKLKSIQNTTNTTEITEISLNLITLHTKQIQIGEDFSPIISSTKSMNSGTSQISHYCFSTKCISHSHRSTKWANNCSYLPIVEVNAQSV